jgi:hypothetical protein
MQLMHRSTIPYCYRFVSPQMKTLSLVLRPLLVGLTSAGPVQAKVLAEGKPKGGYDWQKIEQSSGIRYLCRTQAGATIQKADQCSTAGAVKPE